MNSLAIPLRAESTQSPSLIVRLLGDFVLHNGADLITQVNTPRLQALLTYLLLHRQAPQSRRSLHQLRQRPGSGGGRLWRQPPTVG